MIKIIQCRNIQRSLKTLETNHWSETSLDETSQFRKSVKLNPVAGRARSRLVVADLVRALQSAEVGPCKPRQKVNTVILIRRI